MPWCAGSELTLGPWAPEASQLTATKVHRERGHAGPPPFLPLAELHLQLGSVILVFSTLGISRSCAAILAFLMHWNEQTLKVRTPQARIRLQLPPAGSVRTGPGRKGAQALPWGPNWGAGGRGVREGSSKSRALSSIHAQGQGPRGLGQGLRL